MDDRCDIGFAVIKARKQIMKEREDANKIK